MAMKKSSFNLLPDNVTPIEDVKEKNTALNETNVTSTNETTQPQQTSNVTYAAQPQQTTNVTYDVQPSNVTPERKRIYVSITMDHYLHAKRECGATGITLQDYFDSLIEKDMKENTPHYIK